MLREDYQISFNCPGFLGDAEQQSAWRTPPFKALLQHWWRIAVARQYGYDWQKIREAEGRLFGHAWLDNGNWAMRSRVKIRLEESRRGSLSSWQKNSDPKVSHGKAQVGSQLYLGYGPLDYKKDNGLKNSPAIKPTEENRLTLIYPEQEREIFQQVMQLIHWFGTLGGRSRNGWGSISLAAPGLENYSLLLSGHAVLGDIQKPFQACLREEWPHAIGCDDENKVLLWKTAPCKNWMEVIKKLAEIKIGFRRQLSVTKPFDERQILALPVTKHTPRELANDRVANQIRFKVIENQNQCYGLIFHLPCKIPQEISKKLTHPAAQNIIASQAIIWKKVHDYLDSANHLQRIGSK